MQRTLSEVFNVLFEPTVTQATQPLGRVNLLREYEIQRLLFKHVFNRSELIAQLRKECEYAGDTLEIAHDMLPENVDDLQRGSKKFFEDFHRAIVPLMSEIDRAGERSEHRCFRSITFLTRDSYHSLVCAANLPCRLQGPDRHG